MRDLAFNGRPGNTIGIELEIQILDRHTGDLVPGAIQILERCKEEGLKNVSAEFLQSMIEIKTGICRDVVEAETELTHGVSRLSKIAETLGFSLGLGGTHPFNLLESQSVFPAERYELISKRMASIAHYDVVFGVHVHVGVEGAEKAIGVMNYMVQYLPHLLALSANSPYWKGKDTGLASARCALYSVIPHSGVPPFFSDWKEFKRYLQVMLGSNALKSIKDIYWDIRPRADFGTLEFRIFDTPSRLEHVLSFAALSRSLVIEADRLLDARPNLVRGDRRRQWIAPANKWLATRYGLEATYIRSPSGKRRSLHHDLSEVIERVRPIARESGEEKFLLPLLPLENWELGFKKQRKLVEEGGWKGLIEDMIYESKDWTAPLGRPNHIDQSLVVKLQ